MLNTGTDLIKHLGELAFATRLKRLAESLQNDVARIYREMDVAFEPKWFTMLYALHYNKSMSVIELASLLKLTHPAIIQFAEQMQKQKLVSFVKDKTDKRKKLIQLTVKGTNVFNSIEPVLQEIELANREFIRETGTDVLGLIEKMELQLEERSMYTRVRHRLNENFRTEIQIVEFDKRYQADFKKLNEEWLEKYFKVEASDTRQLVNPQKEILRDGGEIFFALYNDQVIGTCAIRKGDEEKSYEILKMAVTEKYQSHGIGRMLVEKAIEYAKKKGASKVVLFTSRKLENAMKLYNSLGFEIVDNAETIKYERCTVYMTKDITALLLLVISVVFFCSLLNSQLHNLNLYSQMTPVYHISSWIQHVSTMIGWIL